eukprot:scaffold49454_cov71-Phaeocystis_antarctica.AAC.3
MRSRRISASRDGRILVLLRPMSAYTRVPSSFLLWAHSSTVRKLAVGSSARTPRVALCAAPWPRSLNARQPTFTYTTSTVRVPPLSSPARRFPPPVAPPPAPPLVAPVSDWSGAGSPG